MWLMWFNISSSVGVSVCLGLDLAPVQIRDEQNLEICTVLYCTIYFRKNTTYFFFDLHSRKPLVSAETSSLQRKPSKQKFLHDFFLTDLFSFLDLFFFLDLHFSPVESWRVHYCTVNCLLLSLICLGNFVEQI
jgi:hypothetical protein